MPKASSVVFYVSSHGYGHATRQSVVIDELHRRRPDLRLLARTQAPAWLVAPEGHASCRYVSIDPGIIQPDGFTIDHGRTLKRHERFVSEWDGRVRREAEFLRRENAVLVVSDIAALAFAAADKAGVPAVCVGNFSWDVILEAYAAEPRWRPIIELYRKAYGRARAYFRLPMHLPAPAFPRVVDCPLLAMRSPLTHLESRRKLGLPQDSRPVVLASFGGFGRGELDLSGGDDLSDFLFIGFGPPPKGCRAQWTPLPQSVWAHADAMAACDVALAKPGYGVLSEALAQGRPVTLLERQGFAETPSLVEAFLRLGCGRALGQADFSAGRWRAALEEALALPPKPPVDCAGAGFLADQLPLLLE